MSGMCYVGCGHSCTKCSANEIPSYHFCQILLVSFQLQLSWLQLLRISFSPGTSPPVTHRGWTEPGFPATIDRSQRPWPGETRRGGRHPKDPKTARKRTVSVRVRGSTYLNLIPSKPWSSC